MATYNAQESRIRMSFQIGTNPSGSPKMRSESFGGIDATAVADDVDAVLTAYGGLLDYTVSEKTKEDEDIVVSS